MVKGIILDIDGVIIGEKKGINFPNPHPQVISKLKQIRAKGIPIALCTAKPQFAMKDVVIKIGLDNYHVTDGGAVIINPINKKIAKKITISKKIVKEILQFFLKNDVYTEFYTVNSYVIQENQVSDITRKHTPILMKKPKIVTSLINKSLTSGITKIMLVAKNEKDKLRIANMLKPFCKKVNIYWGLHPTALPLQFGVLTALDVSKKKGCMEVSKNTNVPFKQMLGVGDALGDWQFIKMCKYQAATGNAKQELKNLVLKNKKHGYIGPSVNQNGIISILKHFGL
ncbi:HAD hydrolase family protein [Patescibacteria group bacterium]